MFPLFSLPLPLLLSPPFLSLYVTFNVFTQQRDFDMVDYINELREGCLEAYTGIVQGLKGDNEKQINCKISGVHVHTRGSLHTSQTSHLLLYPHFGY